MPRAPPGPCSDFVNVISPSYTVARDVQALIDDPRLIVERDLAA